MVVGLALVTGAAACGGGGDSSSASSGPGSTVAAPSGGGSGDPLAPQPLPTKTKVVVGWSGAYEVWSSAIVAQGMGEFAKENLEVEMSTMTSANAIAGMETGRVDVLIGSIVAALFNAVDGGAKFRWVAPAFLPLPTTQEGLWLDKAYLDASGKPDPAKIKGSTLGLGSGGAGASIAPFVNEWLRGMGLTLDDVSFLNATGPDILVALEGGAISAGWLSDPYWVAARDAGKSVLAVPFPPGVSLSGYVLSGDMLSSKSTVGDAFTRALARTNRDYLQGDYHQKPDVVAVIAKALGLEPAKVAAGSGYVFPADLKFDHGIVTKLQETWLEAGDILQYPKPLRPDQFIDTRPVPVLR